MSGAEVLGVVAAVSQLAAYIFKVAQDLKEVKDLYEQWPAHVQNFLDQLDSLRDTIVPIEHNPHLQTRVVEDILARISKSVGDIKDLLQPFFSDLSQGRVRRSIHLLAIKRTGKLVNKKFAELETEKSSLTLLISGSSNKALIEIKNDLQGIMTTTKPSKSRRTSNYSPGIPASGVSPNKAITTYSQAPPPSYHSQYQQPQVIIAAIAPSTFEGNTCDGNSNFIGATTSAKYENLPQFKNNIARGTGNLMGIHTAEGINALSQTANSHELNNKLRDNELRHRSNKFGVFKSLIGQGRSRVPKH
ncbi:hypothetical protein F5884DRAFT_901728 [Xylogone sp. PMI_703]|nr:hypothetical protein F5884DRAFT_901728 [Xylogone sp. PMI_703]